MAENVSFKIIFQGMKAQIREVQKTTSRKNNQILHLGISSYARKLKTKRNFEKSERRGKHYQE